MLKAVWLKHKELIFYIFFGGLTTLVNYVVYFACTRAFSIDYFISNCIAWVIAVAFAYITNKTWVFRSKMPTVAAVLREISLFVSARVFSGVLDIALLWLLFDIMGINDVLVKIGNGVLVIILNYFFSKFIIFKGKGKKSESL